MSGGRRRERFGLARRHTLIAKRSRRLPPLTAASRRSPPLASGSHWNRPVVYAPELTEEPVSTVLRESEAQGVTSVTRLPSKMDRPNPLLKIRFCKTMLPSHLKASYIRYEVRPCMPLPRRCPRCLRYGHGRKICKGRARCRRCAGEHEADGCEAPPHCTMGPHPDLARHQGSRRLVANGVKCMSNYSELSTYHEYGNIFPMSCTVFALQEPEVITLKQSLETSLRLAKSVD